MPPMNNRLMRPKSSGFAGPKSLAGLVGWWDASDSMSLYNATTGGSAVAADGTVARWEDRSGVGNHLTQSVVNNRPVMRAAAIGGRNAVEADGTDDFLQLTTEISARAFTVFAVMKRTSGTVGDLLVAGNWLDDPDNLYGGSKGLPVLLYDSPEAAGTYTYGYRPQAGRFVTAAAMPRSLGDTTAAVMTASFDNPVFQRPDTYKNGTVQTTTGGYLLPSPEKSFAYVLGVQTTASGVPSYVFSSLGMIGEIVWYDRKLTATNRALVEKYLKTKWGTP